MSTIETSGIIDKIRKASLVKKAGRITQFYGLILESDGPDVFLGEQCQIISGRSESGVPAEVIGIRNGRVVLMPYGNIQGIKHGSEVQATGHSVRVAVTENLLGRVLDAFGHPIDDLGRLKDAVKSPAHKSPINPLYRKPISTPFITGIKAIDTFTPIGKGQRMGVFAGSGVGKSTLMGMIARNMTSDVNVIALIGERGREVNDFIVKTLGTDGLAKSVVVVATSDQSPLERSHAALTATTIAEYFRDCGKDVTLMMDSLTRYAMALREVSLSMGEPPTSRGFTPSVFSALPRLLERCSTHSKSDGSMTGIYTVLVEGDDHNDPIADAVRAILDGHIVLSRSLAEQAHYPSIDIMRSVSRLSSDILDRRQIELVNEAKKYIASYEQSKDLIEVGAYKSGTNAMLDRAIQLWPDMIKFLQQHPEESIPVQSSFSQLGALMTNG